MGQWQGGWGPVTLGFKVASRCGSPGSLRPGFQFPLLYPSGKLRESASVGTGNPESCQRKKSRAPQTFLTQNQALRSLRGHSKFPSVWGPREGSQGKEACQSPNEKSKPVPTYPEKLDWVPGAAQGHQAEVPDRSRARGPAPTLDKCCCQRDKVRIGAGVIHTDCPALVEVAWFSREVTRSGAATGAARETYRY